MMQFARAFAVALTGLSFLSADLRAQDDHDHDHDHAGEVHFDVSPAVVGGKVVTNAYTDAFGVEVQDVRVFPYAFGEIPDQPYFLEDPGVHPLPGSGFGPAGTRIGFAPTSNLTYWSGAGSPSFGNVPGGETITFEYAGVNTSTVGGIGALPAGFLFATVDANGEADDHLNVTLGGAAVPAEGFYLLSLSLTTDQPGVTPSDPIFLLYANGEEAEEHLHDAALFVRDTFAAGSNLAAVPEPTSLVALGVAATALLARRRL